MKTRPDALIVMDAGQLDNVFPSSVRSRVAACAELLAPPMSAAQLTASPGLLREAEVLLTGWGVPRMDASFLASAPKLRAVFHAAGSVRSFVTDAVWDRDLTVTSAASANAVPVAQFCLAQIILLLKQADAKRRTYRPGGGRIDALRAEVRGVMDARVGLVSYGLIARLVREHVRGLGLPVAVYDPFLTTTQAEEHGVAVVDLDTLFATCEVVSVHTPLLPETRGLIRGAHLRSMSPGAGFVNTARGAVVNEPELCDALADRPDITAVLDVTSPEPPLADSPLWSLPNVVLTPHLAGAQGRECRRLGEHALAQMLAYVDGGLIEGRVTRESLVRMA